MQIICSRATPLPLPRFVGMVLLLALGASGCGRKTATVTGKVMLDNQPVPNATVTFYGGPNESVVAGARTKEDGSYTVANAPVGKVKITVKTVAPPQEGPGTGPSDVNKDRKEIRLTSAGTGLKEWTYVPLDPRYADLATSGLGTEVEKGSNTYDIPLK